MHTSCHTFCMLCRVSACSQHAREGGTFLGEQLVFNIFINRLAIKERSFASRREERAIVRHIMEPCACECVRAWEPASEKRQVRGADT